MKAYNLATAAAFIAELEGPEVDVVDRDGYSLKFIRVEDVEPARPRAPRRRCYKPRAMNQPRTPAPPKPARPKAPTQKYLTALALQREHDNALARESFIDSLVARQDEERAKLQGVEYAG